MALQGTLETFSVPEVLRLLSNTRKTGLLAVDGDRGTGNVWLRDGSIIAARSDHERSGDIDAALFDLLRFGSGDFVFEADAAPADGVEESESDVEAALGRAESLIAEWREIESVVPSLSVGVRLVSALTGESVTITNAQWQSLAAVGGGTTAAALGQRLDLGELDTCRRIRDLVEASLVEVTDDAPESEPEPEPDVPQRSIEHDLSSDEVASLGSDLASFVARPVEEDETAEAGPDTDDVIAEVDLDTDLDTDEFLAQLTNLSPKAAAAIEATAEEAAGREPADHDAAATHASEPNGDEEINRNLLLKFLSSTKN